MIRPFLAVLQYDSSLFLPFLLSTLLIALAVFAASDGIRAFSIRRFVQTYFNRSVWAHRSTVVDYKFYVVNGILFPVIAGPMILSGGLFADWLHDGLVIVTGTNNPGGPAGAGVTLAFTLCFFIAYDLGRYLGHSLQHGVPVLWQFHKIHHSAEVLTPFTNFRAHPVDLIIMAVSANLFTGVVTGVFMFVFAGKLYVVTFLSLHVLIFLYNMIGNLRHTHVWVSYGKLMGHVFISPAQHQIHHSIEPAHFGKNRGFALAIWDWMFGTLYVPVRKETFEIGLGDGSEADYSGVWNLYARPFQNLRSGEN